MQEEALLERLSLIYESDPGSVLYHQLLHNTGAVVSNDMSVMKEALPIVGEVPGAGYDANPGDPNGGSKFGKQLAQTAHLIKAGVGLKVAALEIFGWDTHSNQVAGQASRLNEFGSNIAAFYNDLKAAGLDDKVVIVTMTEFGRTVKENASEGTDHGDAGAWFVISGAANFNGGIWEGYSNLENQITYSGTKPRYLKYNTDFRNVVSEVVIGHLGISAADIGNILPGHNYAPIGFL
jgi:uncharacterized protein (DUF1501 family)